MKGYKKIAALLFAVAAAAAAYAASFQPPALSGNLYTYFRYDLTSKDEPSEEGANEFDVGRCYINVKGAVTEKLYYRFTADIYRPTTYRYTLVVDPETGETSLVESSSKGPLAFAVKYAYADVRELLPQHSLYAGVIPTSWVDFENDLWGFRVIRKTVLDDRGWASSADLGLGLTGSFGEGLVQHHLTVGNGAGYNKAESGLSGKDVEYRLSLFPFVKNEVWKGVSANAYVRAGNLGEKVADDELKNPVTAYGGLLAVDHDLVTVAGGYFLKTSKDEGNGTITNETVEGNILTAYAAAHFRATEGMTVHPIVRYDSYEPNTSRDDDERQLVIAGLAFKFFDGTLAVVPNYQTESYKEIDETTGEVETKSQDNLYLHCQLNWK